LSDAKCILFFPPDTGGGNALNVKRTVQDLMAAGAAGCFLEVMDSSSPCLARTVHHMFPLQLLINSSGFDFDNQKNIYHIVTSNQ
jgi:hypothetical protein